MEGETGAYYPSLLDAATMELFSGEEHMRDERGSSVSPSHRSLRALWVKLFVLSGRCFLFVAFCVCFVCLVCATSPSASFCIIIARVPVTAN